MFNFGLFSTHIPYIVLAALYSLYLVSYSVSQYFNHSDEIVEDKAIIKSVNQKIADKSSTYNYSSFYDQDIEDIHNISQYNPGFHNLDIHKNNIHEKIISSYLLSINRSNPPPFTVFS